MSARSFVILHVRCDEGEVVRMLQTGYEGDPSLHDPRGTAATQLPQLLILKQIDEKTIEMTQ